MLFCIVLAAAAGGKRDTKIACGTNQDRRRDAAQPLGGTLTRSLRGDADMAAKPTESSTATFSENWAIYNLYVRQEYDECLEKIEQQLKLCNGLCEYAVFVKGANCDQPQPSSSIAGRCVCACGRGVKLTVFLLAPVCPQA